MVSALKDFKERYTKDCAPYFTGKAHVTGSNTLEDSAYSASIEFSRPGSAETKAESLFNFNASYIQETEESEGHYSTSVIFNDFTTSEESKERKERYVEALTNLLPDTQDIQALPFNTCDLRVSSTNVEPMVIVAALHKANLLTPLQYDEAESLAVELQNISQQERTARTHYAHQHSDQEDTNPVFA
ncbi:MAG: hypothetical protein ACRBCK_01735 [Alphaproteobacteria bacterium]